MAAKILEWNIQAQTKSTLKLSHIYWKREKNGLKKKMLHQKKTLRSSGHISLKSTVVRHIFVHMIFVASDFEATYFMFKSYYMGENFYQKKALSI